MFKLLDKTLLTGHEFASLSPLPSVCKGSWLRYTTSQVAGTFCQIRSHALHSSVHLLPKCSMYCQVPLVLGLPHSDVLNPVRAVFSFSYSV